MQQSAAAGAAYWDAQPGQQHPRSFTAAASPRRSFLHARPESADGRSSSSLKGALPRKEAQAAAEQPPSGIGEGQALAGPAGNSGRDTESNGVATAMAGVSAKQKVVPSERLRRPSLVDLFADLPAALPRKRESPVNATSSGRSQDAGEKCLPPVLPLMSSGALSTVFQKFPPQIGMSQTAGLHVKVGATSNSSEHAGSSQPSGSGGASSGVESGGSKVLDIIVEKP